MAFGCVRKTGPLAAMSWHDHDCFTLECLRQLVAMRSHARRTPWAQTLDLHVLGFRRELIIAALPYQKAFPRVALEGMLG